MAFTATTYNVLASAYIRPPLFPETPPALLDPPRRRAAVGRHVAQLDSDLICMQEVEVEMFEEIDRHLAPEGCAGMLVLKGIGKPDGCATFVRDSAFTVVRTARFEYDDGTPGTPASGHIAQLSVLQHEERMLGVANTHLKWDPPDTPPERRYGLRQILQLLDARERLAPGCHGWIVCGDLNVTSDDEVVQALIHAGFTSSHLALGAATCNPSRRAKMIDYLFHDAGLTSLALPLPAITDATPLPGPDEPSDHVAVTAQFRWARQR